jgi:ATP-binding cassette subfamily B protein/subfamily B ATP-binding cassette protein MsbA
MKEFLQMMLRYVAPYKKYLSGSIGLNILSAVFNIFSFSLVIPLLQILFKLNDTVYTFIPWDSDMGLKDKIINNTYYWVANYIGIHGGATTLLILCVILIIMTLLKTSCYFGSSAIMIPIRTGIVKDIRMQIYNKILSLPLGFFSQEKKGDIIARMSGDVMEVENSITSSIDILIKDPILILFYSAALLFTSWQMTLFTILFVPLMGWIMGVIGKQLKRRSLEAQSLWSDTMSQIEETLGGLRVIKAFIAEHRMSVRFDNVTEAMRRKNNKVGTRQALAHPMSEFLGTVMITFVLCFGGVLILRHHSPIDAPTFIFFLVMLYSIINPLKELTKASYGIPKGLASMERINKILDTPSDINEIPETKHISEFKNDIAFNKVCFSYKNGNQILYDIDIDIKKGETVAIVGESGAGKSTLVDLIPRFYDIQSGSITIDGIDIKDMKISELRSLMGIVNQDPILFNDTIFNNIAFGMENVSYEQVLNAAKIANAHEFILEKKEGYNTNIGDCGVKLSGGQRQRLSIARAILKNPPILILDEATAALDTESERIVQEALDRLMSNRTTIAIAHRLSTIKNADEIIVMKEGKIVERGKHEELIAMKGYYNKLHNMQAL